MACFLSRTACGPAPPHQSPSPTTVDPKTQNLNDRLGRVKKVKCGLPTGKPRTSRILFSMRRLIGISLLVVGGSLWLPLWAQVWLSSLLLAFAFESNDVGDACWDHMGPAQRAAGAPEGSQGPKHPLVADESGVHESGRFLVQYAEQPLKLL